MFIFKRFRLSLFIIILTSLLITSTIAFTEAKENDDIFFLPPLNSPLPETDREKHTWRLYHDYKKTSESIKTKQTAIDSIKKDLSLYKPGGKFGGAFEFATEKEAKDQLSQLLKELEKDKQHLTEIKSGWDKNNFDITIGPLSDVQQVIKIKYYDPSNPKKKREITIDKIEYRLRGLYTADTYDQTKETKPENPLVNQQTRAPVPKYQSLIQTKSQNIQPAPGEYNPLADPGMDLQADQKKTTKASNHTKQFEAQSATGTRPKETTGIIGGGDIATPQPNDYIKGKIGAISTQQPQQQGLPDNEGTGGLSSVRVGSQDITLSFWDHKAQDGDIINIYLNGQLISGGIHLEKAKKSVQVRLNSGKNLFEIEAVNEGKEPPNTAAVAISNVTAGSNIQISRRSSGQKASMNLYAP